MSRRHVISACLLSLVFAASAAAATSKPVSWAAPQIRAVTAAGLMDAPTSPPSAPPTR